MSSCQLMFPGVRSFLVFSSFGLSLLPLAFSLILTVVSRLLHPYSTNDKTSRLMVKKFSTVGDTQRGSQSYMEKRRGRKEIEVTRRRRGGVKRGESNQASNHTPLFKENGLPFWVSLTVENIFTINLDVLSLVLYGWRSLEASVRIRLKTRGGRIKSKM